MTTGEIVTLSAAVIALLGSILSLAISTKLAIGKERRQILWTKELERLFTLEELAGSLVQELYCYSPLTGDAEILRQKLWDLQLTAGRLARYSEVRTATQDMFNTLSRLFVVKGQRGDWLPLVSEAETAFRKLLDACDKVTERNPVGTVWHGWHRLEGRRKTN